MSVNINRLIGKWIADRYCIIGEIGAGGMGRVFRGMPFDDPSRDVAIKVILRDRRLNSEDLLRFQKEAALMSRLHHPNIICFHELGLLGEGDRSGNANLGTGYYIVMEIANGRNLKESLAHDGRKDLAFFFQVGLQVTSALDYTHGKNIIHRDIKPQNIVVGRAWHDQRGVLVKVLDFGVARLQEAMHFSGANGQGFEEMAGTPLYMAPEQTRLMDAPVDHRVDLYSLGCVLYEILTGRPPFTGNTRDKLARQHVNDNPESLRSLRPDVSPIIERIVHKLLAKHPDERYQSAFALHSDLQRAKRRLERRDRSHVVNFPLALNDKFQSVSARLPLVGREEHMQTMVESYQATSQERSRSRLTAIRGGPGTGKSRLLAEFRTYLTKRKVRFVSATFSEHENALQFNALANGFNDYLSRIRKGQPHEAEEFRRRLRTLLGPTAHQVAEVVPGLEPFIKDIPFPVMGEDSDGVGKHDFQTFAKAFSDFTRCLAVDANPVVFLFDDLHWADEKSLDLIDQFFSHNNSQKFLLIVSYRPIDFHDSQSQRLSVFLEKFQKLRRRYEEIEVLSFVREDVAEITAQMLNSADSVTDDFVDYLVEETACNPLHLVELVKSLVSRDLIYLKNKSGTWQYDIETIRQSPHQLDTVDLVLSRIERYQETNRTVLEVAATIGMTFQFELLLYDGRGDSLATMRALTQAIDDGLVTRVNDEQEMRHFGKTFAFSHWRLRDAVYKSIAPEQRQRYHRAIALKLSAVIGQQSAKEIFATAHHINRSLDGNRAENAEVASYAVRANVSAGRAAWEAGALQSAERYYEFAHQLQGEWADGVCTSKERADVLECLADLAALQRKHGQALKTYRELLSITGSWNHHLSIVCKTVQIQMIGGVLSESTKLIFRSLSKAGQKIPSTGMWSSLLFWFSCFKDVFPRSIRHHRYYHVLKSTYKTAASGNMTSDEQAIVNLYKAATQIKLLDNPRHAMLYHQQAVDNVMQGGSNADTVIRVISERAVLLGYLGAIRLAYNLVDVASNMAKSLKLWPTYGYLCMLRALSLDYVRGRHEEVQVNMRNALQHVSKDWERVSFGSIIVFKMYKELISGRLPKLHHLAKQIPETIPTRNWLSPRAMALNFYSLLLMDSRDAIVAQGEQYLARREQVAARKNDLFVKIIQVIVTYARGEIDRTREYYASAMQSFVEGNRKEFLWPFEEDFVAIFAFSFPIMFEQEYGRRLMRDVEMAFLLERLDKRIRKIWGMKRCEPSLVLARSSELLGRRPSKVRIDYDRALRESKVLNAPLLRIFSYLWFGDYLYRQGLTVRKDYIRKAHVMASRYNMRALVEYIEKLMEKRGISYQKAIIEPCEVDHPEKDFSSGFSKMCLEHLQHVCEVLKLDTAGEQDVEESLAILKRHLPAYRYWLIVPDQQGQPRVLDADNPPEGILDYVAPYLQVRSTLFLPTSDAPWTDQSNVSQHNLTIQPDATVTPDGHSTLVNHESDAAGDETIVFGDHSSSQSMHHTVRGVTNGLNDGATVIQTGEGLPGGESLYDLRGPGLQMNALVPLRASGGGVGLIFIEDVDLQIKDSATARQELDIFGAQLGILLESKLEESTSFCDVRSEGLQVSEYRPGDYSLEPVSWLQLWHHGKLRASRETAWYLGLQLSEDTYLVGYCRLNGQQELRERLGSLLWHHLLVVRSLHQSSGRSHIDLHELRDELVHLLRNTPGTKSLEAVSLTISSFDRRRRIVSSGHFGPSRPLVICQENRVSPLNEVVLTLSNSRDLRFWSVSASMQGAHLFMLAHDTSKLDVSPSETFMRSLRSTSYARSEHGVQMHGILERLVHTENLPRYYLGAVMLEENLENSGEQQEPELFEVLPRAE